MDELFLEASQQFEESKEKRFVTSSNRNRMVNNEQLQAAIEKWIPKSTQMWGMTCGLLGVTNERCREDCSRVMQEGRFQLLA